MPFEIKKDGTGRHRPWKTPAEEQDFELYYAAVLEREAAVREASSPDFAAFLRSGAEKARIRAAAIDTRPPQLSLF